MGETHVGHIRNEAFGQFVPGQERTVVAPPPRTGMDFVDGDGLAARVGAAPELAVPFVAPLVAHRQIGHRRGRRPQFRAEGEGIGLERDFFPFRTDDLELVGLARADIGKEDFPDAGVDALAHDVAAAVPVVELADDRDAPCIRRPDGEMNAACAFVLDQMRA